MKYEEEIRHGQVKYLHMGPRYGYRPGYRHFGVDGQGKTICIKLNSTSLALANERELGEHVVFLTLFFLSLFLLISTQAQVTRVLRFQGDVLALWAAPIVNE